MPELNDPRIRKWSDQWLNHHRPVSAESARQSRQLTKIQNRRRRRNDKQAFARQLEQVWQDQQDELQEAYDALMDWELDLLDDDDYYDYNMFGGVDCFDDFDDREDYEAYERMMDEETRGLEFGQVIDGDESSPLSKEWMRVTTWATKLHNLTHKERPMSNQHKWNIASLPTKHGRMICSCCGESIEGGLYRWRLDDTRDIYVVQHRACTEDAQCWVELEIMLAQAKQIIRNKLADFEALLAKWPDEREVEVRVRELRRQVEQFYGSEE
jgi:hypothetical protein